MSLRFALQVGEREAVYQLPYDLFYLLDRLYLRNVAPAEEEPVLPVALVRAYERVRYAEGLVLEAQEAM